MSKDWQKNDTATIDLGQVFHMLWRNLYLLIVSALAGAFLLYLITDQLIPKRFQSTTSIYVINRADSELTVTYYDLQTGSQLTKDYGEIIKSRTVMNQVIADLDLSENYPDMRGITAERLNSMVSVVTDQETRVVSLTVTDTNPARAQDIANAVRKAAADLIYQVMDIKSVNVVDEANLANHPVSPSKSRNTLIGGLLGLILAAACLIIQDISDDTIRNAEDVEKFLHLSVLGVIPYDKSMDVTKEKASRRK